MALAVALLWYAGCSWTHDDYPDRSCGGNTDCFRAQGEYCDRDAGICVAGTDAAVEGDAPDAGESGAIDAAAEPDAGADADADAGPADAAPPDAAALTWGDPWADR